MCHVDEFKTKDFIGYISNQVELCGHQWRIGTNKQTNLISDILDILDIVDIVTFGHTSTFAS